MPLLPSRLLLLPPPILLFGVSTLALGVRQVEIAARLHELLLAVRVRLDYLPASSARGKALGCHFDQNRVRAGGQFEIGGYGSQASMQAPATVHAAGQVSAVVVFAVNSEVERIFVAAFQAAEVAGIWLAEHENYRASLGKSQGEGGA